MVFIHAAETSLSLSTTEDQESQTPVHRVAAHITGNSNRMSSSFTQSKTFCSIGKGSKYFKMEKDHGLYVLCGFPETNKPS